MEEQWDLGEKRGGREGGYSQVHRKKAKERKEVETVR